MALQAGNTVTIAGAPIGSPKIRSAGGFITLPGAPVTDPKFKLTYLSLLLILIAIIGIGYLLVKTEFDGSNHLQTIHQQFLQDTTNQVLSDSAYAYRLAVFKTIQEEHKDFRTFFLSICQMVLLNLLLPILTAILGYRVGSKNE